MIKDIQLQTIFNTRGDKTTEATIISDTVGIASSPSGISESSFAAKPVPITKGRRHFKKIKKKLLGEHDQKSFDSVLRKNLDKLGTNITTALSLAFFNTNPEIDSQTFPYPLGNVLGGGAHGKGISIQEILVLPVKAKNIFQAVETNFSIYKEVGERLKKKVFVGQTEESAWSSPISDEEALDLVHQVAKEHKARLGIDLAASQLHENGAYHYSFKDVRSSEQIDLVSEWIKDFDLYYVEDPFHESDFSSFRDLTKKFSKRLICGDDLIGTHVKRLRQAVRKKAGNSVIVKPNQAGTVTEAFKVIDYASKKGWKPVLSHRSAETTDTTPAYLSLKTPLCKFGVAGERISILNELIRIWRVCKKPRMAGF